MASSKKVPSKLLLEIKEELLRKKDALAKNIHSELDEMRSGSQGYHLADMDDLGGDATDEETSFKILEIESASVHQIDTALKRIDAGTYGSCDECSAAINPERLKALPFATLCINCQREKEREED